MSPVIDNYELSFAGPLANMTRPLCSDSANYAESVQSFDCMWRLL